MPLPLVNAFKYKNVLTLLQFNTVIWEYQK